MGVWEGDVEEEALQSRGGVEVLIIYKKMKERKSGLKTMAGSHLTPRFILWRSDLSGHKNKSAHVLLTFFLQALKRANIWVILMGELPVVSLVTSS